MIQIKLAELANATEIAQIEQSLQGSHAWSEKQVRDAFTDNAVILVAVDSSNPNKVVGYALVQYVLDEAELHIVGVERVYQRRGIAKKLLDELMNQLKKKQVNQLFLEVRESNIAAILLYESFCFVQLGRRKDYYAVESTSEAEGGKKILPTREDALVMSCKL